MIRLLKRVIPNWNYHHGSDSGNVFTGCNRKSTLLIINRFIERFNGSFRREFLNAYLFKSLSQVKEMA
ncbi:transposase [Morganella morganii]|uniref:transposase n=1 Tax=Morganella morganii TaxID=582 RepID=UPI001FFCBA02|nr:transposase [Morganella morganii]